MYKGATSITKKNIIFSLVGISLTALLLTSCSGDAGNKASIASPSPKTDSVQPPLPLKLQKS